ncbi:hypothetical protein DOZ80_17885 [Pseudomonas fluorescens]|uniref:Uncharacterized protein n=1 Tax=Pseudomonas fluorescens TaxID=294 RepID=A0A327MZW6_PSEFL|nr:hypothetical protein DOZ80_17885 [Pseudomonas fluorescens]
MGQPAGYAWPKDSGPEWFLSGDAHRCRWLLRLPPWRIDASAWASPSNYGGLLGKAPSNQGLLALTFGASPRLGILSRGKKIKSQSEAACWPA